MEKKPLTTIKAIISVSTNYYDIKKGSSDKQTYLSASGWINQARKSYQIQVVLLRQGLRQGFQVVQETSCFFTDD